MLDPKSFLQPPVEPEESSMNGFPDPGYLFNYVSPTAWINAAIESVTGKDCIGECTEWVGGDWLVIWKFGDAMTNLARCADQVAVNAQQGMLLLDSGWDGNANDAAANYFTSLASSVSDLRFALTDIGDAYKKAANGAWGLALELGNILQALGDYAIVAGIVAVGSPLLLAGGVGVAGYAALALIAAKMVQLASSLSLIINTGLIAIFGFFGTGMSVAFQGGGLSAIKLPGTAYAGPGA
jgi:hypothetical protein